MIRRISHCGRVLIVLLFMALNGKAEQGDFNLKPWGLVSFEAGQIEKGWYIAKAVDHVWQQGLFTRLGVDVSANSRLHIMVAGECHLTFSYPVIAGTYATEEPLYTLYIHQAEGVYTLGDQHQPLAEIGFGIFPFKYNPDVKDLGEYLFRTGTYPGYIINSFDFPMAKLLGLTVSDTLFGALHNVLLLTSETQMFPTQDFTLSYLGDVVCAKFLDIGGGVSWCHLLSVNDDFTTPHTVLNQVIGDSTHYYTFKGTKLMARFSIDPKVFFPSDIFGSEDLRLYGEGTILGLKNYPGYYAKLNERMPLMAGFNIPAFKLLDELSVEMEWYDSPFPNSYRRVYEYYLPLPSDFSDSAMYKSDNWKWSVYAEKTVAGGISLIAQVARDHVRTVTHDYMKQDKEEALRTTNDWYYMLKCKFAF